MSLTETKPRITVFVSHRDKTEKTPFLSEGQTNIYYYVIYILSAMGGGQKYY